MALPFVLGLALGAGAVVAFNNSKALKEKTKELLGKSKEFTSSTLEQGKDMACDVKDTVVATKECIKEKKEQIKQDREEECCNEEVVEAEETTEVEVKEEKA